jgi:hypothetical protein
LASAPASYNAMRVASEQASGEKYRSMDASLAGSVPAFETQG